MRTGAALVVTVVLGLATVAGAASAETKTRTDPTGDATANRFDIVRGAYRNAPDNFEGRIDLVNLRRKPALYTLTFSPLNTPDVAFEATSRRTADGRTIDRLHVYNDIGERLAIRCDVRSRWRFADDILTVDVPRSCVDGATGRFSMAVAFGRDRDSADRVRSAVVSRG